MRAHIECASLAHHKKSHDVQSFLREPIMAEALYPEEPPPSYESQVNLQGLKK